MAKKKSKKRRGPQKVRPCPNPPLDGGCLRIVGNGFCGRPATEVVGMSALCQEHAPEARKAGEKARELIAATGWKPPSAPTLCETCQGSGEEETTGERCDACGGAGTPPGTHTPWCSCRHCTKSRATN